MADPHKILILTADVGFGHRMAANAIQAAFEQVYGAQCLVEVVNLLDDQRTPAFLRDTQVDYDKTVRQSPDLYKLRYQFGAEAVPMAIAERALIVLLFNVIRDLLKRFQPEAIVITHPYYPSAVNAVISLNKLPVSFSTVITDLTSIHRQWFNAGAEFTFVPTQEAYDEALANDLTPENVRITGIPIHPNFVKENRSPEIIRADLGWQTDVTTVLVVGSKRVNHLEEVLYVLNHSGLPLQLAIVTGGDDELYEKLKTWDWHVVTHLYNFVDDMSPFMHAADCVLTKAGGLVVSEAFACGLPLLFIDVTPGQEIGNADYVIKNGAGERGKTPAEALETLFHWLDHDKALLARRASRAAQLARPRSAFAVSERTWEILQRGPYSVPETRLARLPKLRELLNQFKISEDNSDPRD
jgi:UDP-N-acetylglucosamine:LPS N-acetylglucosamine transferase